MFPALLDGLETCFVTFAAVSALRAAHVAWTFGPQLPTAIASMASANERRDVDVSLRQRNAKYICPPTKSLQLRYTARGTSEAMVAKCESEKDKGLKRDI